MAVVTIPYTPRVWARAMHASWARMFVLVLHRRAGKTTGTLNHHIRAAVNDRWEEKRLRRLDPSFTARDIRELLRERIYAHVLPSLTQARTVAWDKLKYATRDMACKPSERDMSIRFNGPKGSSRIVRLFGADNIDALRGFPLSGLSMDEYSQHPPGIFGEVLSKSLADHLGYAMFLGTIKGKNQLYQAYQNSKDDPEWFTLWQDVNVSIETEDGGTIKALRKAMQEELDLIAKGLMTQEEYDQEWFLSPFAAIKGAYYAKQLADAYRLKRITRVPYDPELPVFDVWDLGKGEKMPVGLFQKHGRSLQMFDYVEGSANDGLPQVIAELKQRWPTVVWGKHFAPHDIKATEISTGLTRLATAKSLGWEFEVVPSVSLADGISKGQQAFAKAWIDEEKCAPFIEAIGQYHRGWNNQTGMFKDEPEHDWSSHPADMWRYAALCEHLMVAVEPRRAAPRAPRGTFDARGKAGTPTGRAWMK